MRLENMTNYENDLKTGYKKLKEGEYMAAIDQFSKINNVPLIGATKDAIWREMKDNIIIMKKMMADEKVTLQEYREVISSYGKQYKYAKRQEENIYNKIKNMSKTEGHTRTKIKEIEMSRGQHSVN